MALGDRPPEPLTPAEMRALLAACDGPGLMNLRNKALIVVMWRAGLRVSEALALLPSDIDFGAGSVRVRHGKGNKARTVGIDPMALEVLSVWLETRRAAGIPDGSPLLCGVRDDFRGRPISTRAVGALLARLGAAAGIGKPVRPHGMRHTMAVELLREGWSVPHISRQLGHSNLGTTAIYLDHLHPREVIEKARARKWA